MSKNTQFDNRSVFFQTEAVSGTPEAFAAASVLYVDNFSPSYYQGDDEEITATCKDGGIRSSKLSKSNVYNSFSFGLPITFPTDGSGVATPGTLASWAAVLLSCNLDATVNAENVVFEYSATGEGGSGTLRDLMEYDSTQDHGYVSAGCRGNVDLTLEHNKRPRFEVSNMMGSYVTPDLAPFQAVDCSTLTDGLAENTTGPMTNEISLAGVNLCVKTVKVVNMGGATLTRDGFICAGGDQTLAEEAQTTIEIEFENTDWAEDVNGDRVEFNVFEMAESHGAINTHPFVLDTGEAGKGLRYEVTEVQATQPEMSKTVGGRKGAKLTLRCITKPVFTVY